MSVLTPHSDPMEIATLAGAKGRGLHQLSLSGFDVPDWRIVGSDVFRRYLDASDLGERIAEELRHVSIADADRVASSIHEWITEGDLTLDVLEEVRRAYDGVGGGCVAVRSSGSEEDGEALSFAGQFATFLNVRDMPGVAEHVRECWASAFSARSLHYRLLHGVPVSTASVAVIVQRMVEADKSGVLFTANPMNGSRDERVISAVYGLGEGLVLGAVDADTVVLDATNAVREAIIGDKEERFDADPAAPGCRARATALEAQQRLALSDEEIASLGKLASRIEDLHRAPQDVEWAISVDRRLWLLQCRPITSPIATAAPEASDDQVGGNPRGSGSGLRIWDNSNIIESFRDITSPLTYSFARQVYQEVYEEYARVLKIPSAQQQEMQEWLPYLLGYINGRVYYNLLNWYRLVRLAPFYQIGRRSLEISLGVEESLEESLAETLRPYSFSSRREELLATVRTRSTFFRKFVFVEHTVKGFLDYFSRTHREFDGVDYDQLPADQVFRRYQILERTLVAKWGAVAILDAVIGISFGALQLLTQRWLPDAPPWFGWAVASPGEDIESAEPARRIVELARKVLADPKLEQLIRHTAADQVYDALEAEGFREFLEQVDSYIAAYGYRSVDELKLEVPDLREDPSGFFILLRNALAEGTVQRNSHDDADEFLDMHLKWFRRFVYERVRRKVRRCLAARENLRFCRTRAFGTAKKMIRAIGTDFARMGATDHPSDIYYLYLDEIRGCFEATIPVADLRELVASRRAREEANAQLTAPSRFSTMGAVYWLGNLDRSGWRRRDAARPDQECSRRRLLTGVAAAPGTAAGMAKVVDTPVEVDGDILVTYRTDPGWVASLPSASALLIERGSPLTHVAIVARELRVPTVVQIRNLTQEIQTGMRLEVDGGSGQVWVLPADE
jgi:rifampicin phosphotransferase